MSSFVSFMDIALDEARAAASRGEVPVGAVIVSSTNQVLAKAGNETRAQTDATAHAEMLVLRAASRLLGRERLTECDLYVTLEPCAMCAAALSSARIRRLYYGASDPKSGGVESGARIFSHPQTHHVPEVYGGIAEKECADLLRGFFGDKR